MVPHEMTFGGGNLDILSGSQLRIYYWGVMKSRVRWRMLVIWNFACVGLLVNCNFQVGFIHAAFLSDLRV